ncbi:MAG: hypothetical protein GXP42_00900 [Chloroflexi bacterium]|nr:hypothetical protein [Chloroflexota bacterium]
MKAMRVVASIIITLFFAILIVFFANQVGLRTLGFAFWVNWFLMFWTHLLMKTTPVRFPAGYYEPRPFEKDIYRLLGVALAKKIYSRAPNPAFAEAALENPIEKRLRSLERAMIDAETAHLMIFIIVGMIMLYALAQAWWDAAAWLFLFNMLFNGYPVMVQRYNRMRICRIN